ncbi:toll/interleukin-1 receptor domain-containing protein [Photobacterium sp. S4TG1]|uniref:toll/interleukin-1 receptor domain-containing protein n=1 Tax=Photobacterium sp. S4TG1 TaxID=3114587 RepID=UPI002E18DA4B|nr:toll/interleukin-1 receptor domain-containing protein [Photobacterium sp. S4TG1]
MTVPKVFISYSHDTQEHKKWVLDLATRLRNSGIDAIIDQWELGPGDDLPHFMETHLASADRVLMICTSRYVEKANSGSGGVGYEKMIITSDLLSKIDSNKVIPVVKQDSSNEVPTFLKSKLYIDFSKVEDYELSYDDLVRSIHGAPLFKKPEIGNNPFKPIEETSPEKNNDLTMDIFKIIVSQYEKGENLTESILIPQHLKCSRIIYDMHLKKLIEEGLVGLSSGYVSLKEKGKQFAVNQGLVS